MNISKIKKKRQGFTLIEMVIVITIIGIISSIGITKYSKVQENAKKNADYVTAANLATVAMISLSDGNTYVQPTTLQSDGYIQFVPKSKSIKDGLFSIIVNDGSITVNIGTETFYPKPDEKKTTT